MNKALQALKIQLALIENLKELTKNNVNFQQWQEKTGELLAGTLGSNAELTVGFGKICYHNKSGMKASQQLSPKEKYLLGLEKARGLLIAAIQEIDPTKEIISEISGLSTEELIEMTGLDDMEKDRIKGEIKKAQNKLKNKKLTKIDEELCHSKLVCLLNKVSDNI